MAIADNLTYSDGTLTPWGSQTVNKLGERANWLPYPAAVPFLLDEETLTTSAFLWLSQAALSQGTAPPVSRGKSSFAILLQQEGVI